MHFEEKSSSIIQVYHVYWIYLYYICLYCLDGTAQSTPDSDEMD